MTQRKNDSNVFAHIHVNKIMNLETQKCRNRLNLTKTCLYTRIPIPNFLQSEGFINLPHFLKISVIPNAHKISIGSNSHRNWEEKFLSDIQYK